MNKTIILAAVIIAIGIVAGAYVIGSFNRYAIIPYSGDARTVCRLDKRTGKTWQIFGRGIEYIVKQMNMIRPE